MPIPGPLATALAAAHENWFDGPMTNLSKVKLWTKGWGEMVGVSPPETTAGGDSAELS